MSPRRCTLAAATLAVLMLTSGPSGATALRERTKRVALGPAGTSANGASTRPVISPDGRYVAFDSLAADMTPDGNGSVRDVFVRDLEGRRVRLVSEGPAELPADGPSSAAAISSGGAVVAFISEATNLAPGDTNGVADVFVRVRTGPVVLASVAADGTPADGPSRQVDISADGTRVVFTSEAGNLTPDDTNGEPDVFVRDFLRGTITRVSRPPGTMDDSDGRSGAPSISPDGRYVSFFSLATDLVDADDNNKGDVFLVDLEKGTVELVSRSTGGKRQNRSVRKPFEQVSDVSRGGRFVVFDSDASNLVAGDRNRDTDVFLRDRRARRTTRVSLTLEGKEGDNDSFYPRITPSGRYVAFQSFAENLFPGDASGEDVFVRDRRKRTTSVMSVTSSGRPRGREETRQLLQRADMADDASVVAFTSTAELSSHDDNRAEDAYVRLTAPPRVQLRIRRLRYRITTDDRAANVFLCRLLTLKGRCPRSASLAFVAPGRYTLRARAIGPGMFMSNTAVRTFRRPRPR